MSDSIGIAPAALLFGHLLLSEIDEELLNALQSKVVSEAMRALELPVPTADQLESLAAEYCAAFIGPQNATPLIQSLYEGGGYEAPSANAVREIAASAGYGLDRKNSRAAPPDHLGSILTLWANLADSWPEHAAQLAQEHLEWALAPLREIATRGGFYGKLATAVSGVIDAIRPDATA